MNTPLWLCETTGQPVSQHDCLDCAEHRRVLTCPFPPTMLRALANSIQGDDTLVEAKQLAREKGITRCGSPACWVAPARPGTASTATRPWKNPVSIGPASAARSSTPRSKVWPARRSSPKPA